MDIGINDSYTFFSKISIITMSSPNLYGEIINFLIYNDNDILNS